jgi:HEAT repeat protein
MAIDSNLPPRKLAQAVLHETDASLVAPFLRHPNVGVRQSAVAALERSTSAEAEPYMLAFIQTSEDRYLVPRINARLGRGATPKAIPALARLVHHPVKDIKASAIDALRRLGDAKTTPIYLDALSDRSWVAKWYAMNAIADHGDLAGLRAVVDRLRAATAKKRSDKIAGDSEVIYAFKYLWRWRNDEPRALSALQWVQRERFDRLTPYEQSWLVGRLSNVT